MEQMRIFVNDRWVEPRTARGSPALDFIRGEMELTGTKEGCREGDCGACAVLVGEFSDESLRYLAVPSCLLATGYLSGKHLITIEGLSASSPDGLTPVMKAFLEENASQCGFCTPGFIVSLSAWLAGPGRPDLAGAMVSVDGNLCRCTGYGSIRRAAERLAREFGDLPEAPMARVAALVERRVLPSSALAFLEEAKRGGASRPLEAAKRASRESDPETRFSAAGGPGETGSVALGGGTDYYVRNPDPALDFRPLLLRSSGALSGITRTRLAGSSWVRIGAAATVREFFASPIVREAVPGIEAFEGEFASTLIRNIATVGGNIANASPVGDITSMLMGLGAMLEIGRDLGLAVESRFLPIEDFFTGYKTTALRENEIIIAVLTPDGAGAPDAADYPGAESATDEAAQSGDAETRSGTLFSFEKIAKRGKLDIAAVNTAISFRIEEGRVRAARISAGGVAAVPMLLRKASAVLEGAAIDRKDALALASLALNVSAAAEEEISPIGDVRGSASYRKRMTGRLILAHFIHLFGADGIAKELFP